MSGWPDVARVAELLSVDPDGLGGVRLRGRPGPHRRRVLDRRPLPEPLAAPATITLLSLGTASLGVLTLVLVWIE